MKRAAARLASQRNVPQRLSNSRCACSKAPRKLESAPLESAGRRIQALRYRCGEVSEWLKERASKACEGESLPRVRIPASPPVLRIEPIFRMRR